MGSLGTFIYRVPIFSHKHFLSWDRKRADCMRPQPLGTGAAMELAPVRTSFAPSGCLACGTGRPCFLHSFANFLNRLLVHVLNFHSGRLLSSVYPKSVQPGGHGLHECGNGPKSLTPRTHTQALPERLLGSLLRQPWKPTSSNMLAPHAPHF